MALLPSVDTLYFLALVSNFAKPTTDIYFRIYGNDFNAAKWVDLFRNDNCWDNEKFIDIMQQLSLEGLISFERCSAGWQIYLLPKGLAVIPSECLQDPRLNNESLAILASYFAQVHELEHSLEQRLESLKHLDTCLSRRAEFKVDSATDISKTVASDQAFWFANKYQLHDRYEEAIKYFQQSIAGNQPADDLGVAKRIYSTDRLAGVYLQSDRLGEAEKWLHDAWNLKLHFYGDSHPATLATLEDLSTCYLMQGRTKGGEDLHKYILEQVPHRERKSSGGYDPIVTDHNDATLLANQGQLLQAEQKFREIVRRRAEDFDDSHPQILHLQKSLAMAILYQGRADEAYEILYDASCKATTQFGLSPLVLELQAGLAACQSYQGYHDSAISSIQNVFEESNESFGPEHPTTLLAQHNLAYFHGRKGSYAQAAEIFREALAYRNRVSGATHPETRRTLNNLLEVLQKMEGHDEESALLIEMYHLNEAG